ncbi:hypothetical protein SLEP1_g53135 [Rubroshorea leprosula]|uniref:F-box domain-containing protein n=1 Tax=Rubroshorea leprosula TaxID=152421 RepID=A0AAV5MB96_9ROSI|nr:hypothetical protein SLEP1_g53135 [Rubroshorea leprosula]
MLDFRALPTGCLADIISLTSPLDACRLSLVSPFFYSFASSDDVWAKFLPADYQNLVPASRFVSPLKGLYLSLCDHPVLIDDGKKVNLYIRSPTSLLIFSFLPPLLIVGWTADCTSLF